ncbi:MAG: hypothetical protein ABI810_02195 [Sphingomonas bacterium]
MAESELLICPGCDTANRVPSARLEQAPSCGKCGAALFRSVAFQATGPSCE